MAGHFKVTFARQCGAAFVAAALMLLAAVASVDAVGLVTQPQAQRVGLKRAWFAQVRLDASRHRVERAVLFGNRLSVLTTAGLLQEFDALTGQTLWIAPVGNSAYASLGPSGDEQHVALLNGSTLYVLDRADGRPVKVRQVGGAPGAAPAVSSTHVFVPLVRGRMEVYPLGEQPLTPWYYQSFGRAMVAPLATPKSFVWATDAGRLYVGQHPDLALRFRLETESQIVAPPAYRDPFVYAATVDGEVFAMHELTGARIWKYASGFPVTRAPAAVDDRVFVTTDQPALHCIDAAKGTARWEAANVAQFAAVSKDRVYGVDELGSLVVLDVNTGARVGRMQTDPATHALVNDQTDRVYLVSQAGQVQCLHELEADEPLYHVRPAAAEEQLGEAAAKAAPPASASTDDAEMDDEPAPFGEETDETEAPAGESPFGAGDDDPFQF